MTPNGRDDWGTWIGLRRNDAGRLVWDEDNSEPVWTTWGSKEPDKNGNCVIYGTPEWYDNPCKNQEYFLCEAKK